MQGISQAMRGYMKDHMSLYIYVAVLFITGVIFVCVLGFRVLVRLLSQGWEEGPKQVKATVPTPTLNTASSSRVLFHSTILISHLKYYTRFPTGNYQKTVSPTAAIQLCLHKC